MISSIGKGILILAAISKDDTEKDIEFMANKILKAKLWDDEANDLSRRVSQTHVNVNQFRQCAVVEKQRQGDCRRSFVWYVFTYNKIVLIRAR